MTCEEARTALSARLDAEPWRERELETHLAECAACRAWQDQTEALARLVAERLGTAPPPEALIAGVKAKLIAKLHRFRWIVGGLGVLLTAMSLVEGSGGDAGHGEAGIWETLVGVGFVVVAAAPPWAPTLRPALSAVAVIAALLVLAETVGLSDGVDARHVVILPAAWAAVRLGHLVTVSDRLTGP